MGVVVMVRLDDVIKAKEREKEQAEQEIRRIEEKKVIAKAKIEALKKIKDILRGHPDLAEELGIEV